MDAPIGYSGAPLIPGRSRRPTPAEGSTESLDKAMDLKMDLNKFPLEILLIVASSLSQFEILTLMTVNRNFYHIFKPFLYRSIVIDQNFSEFNFKEISIIGHTFIKTSYSLKMFLRTLISDPDKCHLIQQFTCSKLPNDTIQFQLYNLLTTLFPLLSNLSELNWYNSNDIDFKLLDKLSAPLLKLHMNMKMSHNMILPPSHKTISSIKSFAFAPFQNSSNLSRVKTMFELSNLDELKLSRLFNKESLLIPPSNTLVTTEDILDIDTNSIALFFPHSGPKYHLSKLSIDGILVQPSDFLILQEYVDLSSLRHLELSNISEIVKVTPHNMSILNDLRSEELTEDLRSTMRSLVEPNMMTHLSHFKFHHLTILKIDIRQGLVDSTPLLLTRLKNLKKLDITSRWNNTKFFQYDSYKILISSLVDSILLHSETLETLSLEFRLENFLINNESLFTIPNDPLAYLLDRFWPRLKGLRINLFANYLILNNFMISCSRFPNLQYLNLFGDGVYNKHMGLEVVNPGILDDFFKIQHIVVNLLNGLDANLQYIMIDENKVFEIVYDEENRMVDIEPREGIESWFISKVRVGFFY